MAVAFLKKEGAVQQRILGWAFTTFFDEGVDASKYENARIAVAEKILSKLLTHTSEPTAIDIMDVYLPRLMGLLRTPFSTTADEICFQLQMKRVAYMLIEEIYKKVPPKTTAP